MENLEKKIVEILGKKININKIQNPVLKQILNENTKYINGKYIFYGDSRKNHKDHTEYTEEYKDRVHKDYTESSNNSKYYPDHVDEVYTFVSTYNCSHTETRETHHDYHKRDQ